MKLFKALFTAASLGFISIVILFSILLWNAPKEKPEERAESARRSAEVQAELQAEGAKMRAELKTEARKEVKTTNDKAEHSDFMAFLMAKDFVTKGLKAPSTAKFADWDESRVLQTKPGEYRVISWVESQNSFGAMLRTQYICEVKTLDAETWTLVQLGM